MVLHYEGSSPSSSPFPPLCPPHHRDEPVLSRPSSSSRFLPSTSPCPGRPYPIGASLFSVNPSLICTTIALLRARRPWPAVRSQLTHRLRSHQSADASCPVRHSPILLSSALVLPLLPKLYTIFSPILPALLLQLSLPPPAAMPPRPAASWLRVLAVNGPTRVRAHAAVHRRDPRSWFGRSQRPTRSHGNHGTMQDQSETDRRSRGQTCSNRLKA